MYIQDAIRNSILADWLKKELADGLAEPPLKEQWELVEQLIEQDTEPDPDGTGARIKRGVAKDRRISIHDADMRHGRKSKSKRIDGYKRHVAIDLDAAGVVCAVAVTPANQPERAAARLLLEGIERKALCVDELYIDRGYLGADAIEERRQAGMQVICKPFPLRNGGRFHKGDFVINLEQATVCCPNNIVVPLRLGRTARFPASQCDPCAQRDQCTTARHGRGRSVSIHPNEPFHIQLRHEAKTPEGRARLRERIQVEHGLATLQNRQGDRARYRELRKNLFDVRRHAALSNISIADRLSRAA